MAGFVKGEVAPSDQMVSWRSRRRAMAMQPQSSLSSAISRYASSGKEYVMSVVVNGGGCRVADHCFELCPAIGSGAADHVSLSLDEACFEVDSGVLGKDGSSIEVSHSSWSSGSISANGSLGGVTG